MASLRHRREMAEAEDYDGGSRSSSGDGTAADSATEEEEEDRLHSMTAKGIQHLCSELLEIKKASEQDFRANVYLSYLSFIRMFQEAGALEKDLHQHVLAHRRLVQHLSNNNLSIVLGAQSIPVDVAATIPVAADHHEEDLELELDVLLSEHRMEEALELLELQGQALQRVTSAEAIASSMSALSVRKARVADRFASVADNPRTPRPELLKALSGLCKLGDTQRANHLLFKFYRPAASQQTCLKKISSNYMKDLANMVFSSILEASRSFVALHGHPSPYTPQLIRWAREEMEDFSVAFSEYVKVGQSSVVLALEAAKSALSYCSLLRIIVSEQDLLDLIAPCLQEVLTRYARHLKEVTRLFVASDAWVLGRFPVSGILVRARSPAATAGLQIEYCLLTASGRKFLTLMQDVVEDVYPLLDLRMNNSVLQFLAGLFREYMHSIVELIPTKEVALHNEDQQYMWQLSILMNCTTLVSLFPTIAHGIFKRDHTSVVTDFSTQGELDSLIFLIKEAAGQVWTCFCQQFIRDTMSGLQKSREGIDSSPQGMMPSFPFQVLFGRVRQLNNLYGTILTGKDGAMKKLLQELMEAMIFWLSNNLDYSWIHQAQGVPRDTLFQQIRLDIHFLLEFAQLGGFSSENIRTGALDLLAKAEEKVAYCSEHDNRNSGNREGWGWAADAAKHAVGVLMAIRSSPDQEASVQNVADAQKEREKTDHDMVESSQEGHKDAPEDHERGAYDGGKSSDEFISIEEDDMSSEELKLGLGSNHQAAPDEYSEIDGEEEKTISDYPASAEVWKDRDDNSETDDHESGLEESPAEMCGELDAIEVEEDDNSCELVLQDNVPIRGTVGSGVGSSQSRRRRRTSTARLPPPPLAAVAAAAAAEKSASAAARSSRKRRETVSRSSRPRWQ